METDRGKLIKESETEALRRLQELVRYEDKNRVRQWIEEGKKLMEKFRPGYEHHKEKCSQCGRRILVQIVLDGSSHNMNVSVVCAECLKKIGVNGEFKKERPEEAKDIEEWLYS